MNKKSPDKVNKVRKIRNMFVLRKGNSTRDSNLTRQNSNDNVYGLERQSSINSLNNSDSWYSRDNSIENQSYIRNQKQASSNGFVNYLIYLIYKDKVSFQSLFSRKHI